MTRAEKQKELKRLLHDIAITDSCTTNNFTAWQGQVAAMLAFNPTLQAEFKEAVKTVPPGHTFSHMAWQKEGGPKANAAIRNVLYHAINELGLPEEVPPASVPVLTDEHGIWWFVSHCTWWARVALMLWFTSLLGGVFFAGLKLGMMDEVKSLYVSFTNPHTSQPQNSPTPAQPNK